MSADPKTWTCPKRSCRAKNLVPKRLCSECGTARKIRRAKHLVGLELPYEMYVELNGGEFCGICLARPKAGGKRFHRDHDHKTGGPRGLLCVRCNRVLHSWVTAAWCRGAAEYLERAAQPLKEAA